MILEDFDQETIELLPSMISLESDKELSMYTIVKWQLVYFDNGEVDQIFKDFIILSHFQKTQINVTCSIKNIQFNNNIKSL